MEVCVNHWWWWTCQMFLSREFGWVESIWIRSTQVRCFTPGRLDGSPGNHITGTVDSLHRVRTPQSAPISQFSFFMDKYRQLHFLRTLYIMQVVRSDVWSSLWFHRPLVCPPVVILCISQRKLKILSIETSTSWVVHVFTKYIGCDRTISCTTAWPDTSLSKHLSGVTIFRLKIDCNISLRHCWYYGS